MHRFRTLQKKPLPIGAVSRLYPSWDEQTAYRGVKEEGNPALGNCYPTAWVVQHFFPETEIIKGRVWNGTEEETHFWNGLMAGGTMYHIDLSWQQFPAGSSVKSYEVLDRNNLGDGEDTIRRCKLLLTRVTKHLAINNNFFTGSIYA